MPIAVNGLTNQLSNANYDLNGNMTSGVGATLTYDSSNRMLSAAEVSGGTEYYGYSPDNKRMYRLTASGTEEWTFYGGYGEKLGVFQYSTSAGLYPVRSNVQFAGRTILDDNYPVFQDRVGTNRASGARFMPFGDEITSTTNDREKFGTYTRDSYTGLDYADQRFYASTYGRFNTSDPSDSSAGPNDPGSWNRYSYTEGDPINLNDPEGLFGNCPSGQHVVNNQCVPDGGGDGGGDDPGGGVGRRPVQRPVKKPNPERPTPTPGPSKAAPVCSSNILSPSILSVFGQMGQALNVNPVFFMALALQESGWNLSHVYQTNPSSNGQPLNNLFGLTNAGGNNLAFPSVQASAQYWEQDWQSYLTNQPQTIQAFVGDLTSDPNHMYNTNPDWPTAIAGGTYAVPITLPNGTTITSTPGTYQSAVNALNKCGDTIP
jgi:RHS repeat-associated protein